MDEQVLLKTEQEDADAVAQTEVEEPNEKGETVKEKKSFFAKVRALYSGKNRKRMIIATIIAVVLIIIFIGIAISKEGSSTIETASSLEKVLDLHDLETFEYPYSAVATVKNEKGKELYYVKYDATVVMAVDLSKVNVSMDSGSKSIIVTLPSAGIKSYNIEYDNLKFMNESKYNDDELINTAKKAVTEDIEARLSNEKQEMFEIARENARIFVEAQTKPIVEQLYSEYTLEVK